jgi:hypothetical protein
MRDGGFRPRGALKIHQGKDWRHLKRTSSARAVFALFARFIVLGSGTIRVDHAGDSVAPVTARSIISPTVSGQSMFNIDGESNGRGAFSTASDHFRSGAPGSKSAEGIGA